MAGADDTVADAEAVPLGRTTFGGVVVPACLVDLQPVTDKTEQSTTLRTAV
jgi:hypothetical protein